MLQPGIRKIVSFSYKATFALIGVYLVVCLAIIFAIIKDWLDQEDILIEISAYIFGGFLFVFLLVMAFYAIGYVWQLWKSGYRKEAIQGLITFIFLNILAGYIWFYWAEIKHQKIRFKLA